MKHFAINCLGVLLLAANLYVLVGFLNYAWWSLTTNYNDRLALGFLEGLKASAYKMYAWPQDIRNRMRKRTEP